MLSAGAAGDLEAPRFFLSLQDRHASGIVHFDQSKSVGGAAAAVAAAVIEVDIKVEAFYESEEVLRAKTRTICALRPSQGQYGIGVRVVAYDMPTCRFPWRVSQAAVPGHEYSARDDVTLNTTVTVWLPGPCAAEAHVPLSKRVIGDSPPHACSAFGGHLSMRLMSSPIEVDTVGLPFSSFLKQFP